MARIKLDRKGRMKESEASVQRRITDYLEAHGFMVMANRSLKGGRLAAILTHDAQGSPDLFVWGTERRAWSTIPVSAFIPRHFAIEVKRKGGKQSEAQVQWAGRYCALGFKYVLAESEQDVEKFLRSEGWL